MPHTIDKTCSVKCLLVKNLRKIFLNLCLVLPVLDILLDILNHVCNLKVGTTMLRSLK